MRCTDNRELTRHQRRMLEKKRRRRRRMRFMCILFIFAAIAAGLLYYFVFRSHEIIFANPYNISDEVYGVRDSIQSDSRAVPFTNDLCVASSDVTFEGVTTELAGAAAMMDLSTDTVLYAQNIHERLYPASLTKIMTALVALKYGNLDDIVFIDEYALDIDPMSSVCYLEYGDQFTLRQLIYGLLIASGNDAGNAIAYHVGGSIDNFVALMNQEAYALGATNTHFVNAHGLQDENHYTTAYDTYLMFSEALKYDVFQDAINQTSYTVTYTKSDGLQYERTWFATSYYFTGEAAAPEDVIVYGGKTGTTDEAGSCLSLLSKDPYGNSYFSIVMKAATKADLYSEMNDLLSIINKK